jgi:hypothetical protein
MKNLICTLLFLAVATFTAQAQLSATLINGTSNETWFLRVEDSHTPPVSLQVGPTAPGASATSNTASVVTPQFLLNAGNYNTGCSVTWPTVGIPSSGTFIACDKTIDWSCAYSPLAPTGYTIKVKVN